MKTEPEALAVEEWVGPPPMDTGAPEPLILREGDTVWVGYRAHNPNFPGWDDPSVIDYMTRNPGEPFGVLRFDGVVGCSFGAPGEDRLHEHPLYGRGLEFYGFHRVLNPTDGTARWIVTFHDETLDIRARGAIAAPMRFASTVEEAVEAIKRAG